MSEGRAGASSEEDRVKKQLSSWPCAAKPVTARNGKKLLPAVGVVAL